VDSGTGNVPAPGSWFRSRMGVGAGMPVADGLGVMSAAESSIAASRALDDLYRIHAGEVYRYAFAILGNHADAEDVTQTTFVNALRALERGERPRKPSNWLITITHNVVRQRFRQQQTRPTEVELDRDVAQAPADEGGPSLEELVRALQRIPQSQREALVLRELEGRSYDEIAQIMDLSKGALETLLFRARRSLADELENAATCDRAELDLSRQLDGRLSRKERRRLDDHIAECPACKRLQGTQGRQRRAFKGLALLPLPLSLTLFKGAPSASAATGLPTIGAACSAAVLAGSGAASGGGATVGGLALGGVAVKAAALVAAVSVASGIGYAGTRELQSHRDPAKRTPVATRVPVPAKPRSASAAGARLSPATAARRKTRASGSLHPESASGSSRGSTAPGRTGPVPGRVTHTRARPTGRADHRARAAGSRASGPRVVKRMTRATLPHARTAPARSGNAPNTTATPTNDPATGGTKAPAVTKGRQPAADPRPDERPAADPNGSSPGHAAAP
jgi:RNA polymerase sigma factor (sigma-70 family)